MSVNQYVKVKESSIGLGLKSTHVDSSSENDWAFGCFPGIDGST